MTKLDDNRVEIIKCENGYVVTYRRSFSQEGAHGKILKVFTGLEAALLLVENLMRQALLE